MDDQELRKRFHDSVNLHPRAHERMCLLEMQRVVKWNPCVFDPLAQTDLPDLGTRVEAVDLEGHYPKAWLVITFLHEKSGVRAVHREDLWGWSYFDGDARTATILQSPVRVVADIISDLQSDLPGIMREAGAPVD